MARSAEKAVTALARWRAAYVDKIDMGPKKRPVKASECHILKDAMFYRRQIVHDISRKIAQIQNPSLDEYKLRDLNDDINKLVREKNHWEEHILTLGGPDFKAEAPKMLEREGKEVPGNRGYRYYGAARDLPGVRELFEEEPQPVARKSRGELMKQVDVAYYGNCDEDDGVIVSQELEYESVSVARKVSRWKESRDDPVGYRQRRAAASRKRKHLEMAKRGGAGADDDQEDEEEQVTGDVDIDDAYSSDDDLNEDEADSKNIYEVVDNPADAELMRLHDELEAPQLEQTSSLSLGQETALPLSGSTNQAEDENESLLMDQVAGGTKVNKAMSSIGGVKRAFVAHVPVYTQDQMEAALVRQRKQQLLDKYMSSDFAASLTETGEILGREPGQSDQDDNHEEEDQREEQQ